jgi:hypothetical protein
VVELDYPRASLPCRHQFRQPGNRNNFIILIHSTDLRKHISCCIGRLRTAKTFRRFISGT